MIEFKYRADVDGLRAVAVLLVLFFHAGLGFPGGFVGVDVFFVISGFLITGLLLKERNSENFRLSHFWFRRIRRILPASTFVVITTLIAGLFVLLPSDYTDMAKSSLSQSLMLSNVYFWLHTGYFSGDAELKPLLHTWSLGVEEQFYIGYPFLVILLSRTSRRLMFLALLLVFAVSFSLSEWGVHTHQRATFYLLPTRAWELILGGLLCFTPTHLRISDWFANCLTCFGILGIIVAATCFDSSTHFPGIAALLPCASAAMVICVHSIKTTWVGTVLATRAFVYVGLISYSLYLWHWPILSLLRHLYCGEVPDVLSRISALVASFVLAALSFRFIETPFRTKAYLADTKKLLCGTVGVVSLVLICSLGIVVFDGIPQRFDPLALSFAASKSRFRNFPEVSAKQVREGDVPGFGVKESSRKCLLWGDSHAMMLVPGIEAACESHNIQGYQATHSETAPVLDFFIVAQYGLCEKAPEFNRAVLDFAIARKVDIIVVAGIWASYVNKPGFDVGFRRTVNESVQAGIKVVIVRDVAAQKGNVPFMLSWAVRLGRNYEKIGVSLEDHLTKNKILHEIFNSLKNENVVVLDPAAYFVDGMGFWPAQISGQSMYTDQHHLTIEGSIRLTPMFEKMFSDN